VAVAMGGDERGNEKGGGGGKTMGGRWLVTLLGKNPRKALYALEGKEARVEAPTAGAALFELLGAKQAFDGIVAVVTPEVRDSSFQDLRAYCERREVSVREALVEQGGENFIKAFLAAFDHCARDEDDERQQLEVTVDLTHGYRHFAVLAYVSLMYLAELRPTVSVRGCYYGELKDSSGDINMVEILDLAPLVEVPDWLYATRSLRQRADALPLAELLKEAASSSGDSKAARRAREGVRGFYDFAKVLNWHCPVDVAERAAAVVTGRKNLKAAFSLAGIPLPEELGQQVARLVERYDAGGEVAAGRDKAKPALSDELLCQHKRAVSDAFEREELPVAAGLLREWMVSWAYREMMRSGQLARAGSPKKWLGRGQRQEAERRLGSLAAIAKDTNLVDLLTEEQREIGELWADVCGLRNSLMHYGMRPQWVLDDVTDDFVKNVKRQWKKWSSVQVDLQIAKRHGCLLVSPLGKSFGVLKSALARCDPRPDMVLCVVSEETQGDAARICQEAGYTDGKVDWLVLVDPRSGVAEVEGLVEKARRELALADCVRVNLTGGTTLMGYIAQRIAEEAGRLSVPVESFVLLEPPQGSDSAIGEIVWVSRVTGDREQEEEVLAHG